MEKRLFVVSGRLYNAAADDELQPLVPTDNFEEKVREYLDSGNAKEFGKVYWTGIIGCTVASWLESIRDLPVSPVRYLPVYVNPHCYDVDSSLVWPFVDHFSTEEFVAECIEEHQKVNEQVLHTLLRHLRPFDTVWINDFHYIPLIRLLRDALPELSIAFALNSSFPSYEVMATLPQRWKEDLLNDLLSADLIRFQSSEFANNFLRTLEKVLGIRHKNYVIRNTDRLIKVDIFPQLVDLEVAVWMEHFFDELARIKQRQQDFQVKFLDLYSRRVLLDTYRRSKKRLLILDYDGTFGPPSSSRFYDDLNFIEILGDLANEKNNVFLISGRTSSWLNSRFGSLDINLIAEDGAKLKFRHGDWNDEVIVSTDWKDEVREIMERFLGSSTSMSIEEKEFSIVLRHSENEVVRSELLLHLREYVFNRYLTIVIEPSQVEVRSSGIDRAMAMRKVVEQDEYDFILALGNNRRDEDVFRELSSRKNTYTIKIGSDASFAKYNLYTQQMVVSLLEAMTHIPDIEMA